MESPLEAAKRRGLPLLRMVPTDWGHVPYLDDKRLETCSRIAFEIDASSGCIAKVHLAVDVLLDFEVPADVAMTKRVFVTPDGEYSEKEIAERYLARQASSAVA